MFREVDTRVPSAVERQVASIYLGLYPEADPVFVQRAFDWANQFFAGEYDEYQAIDARYHDFEHTLQGTLCLARLFHGRHQAKASPPLSRKMFELGLLAILFHDTGYLKKRDDTEGTGAKYTLVHVARSAAFARDFLSRKGFSDTDTTAIQNMIKCTGVNADLSAIPFQSDVERLVGFALGTADLLGQMAAGDYVAKLPVLYQEFAEAARFSGEKASRAALFSSADDLMRKTPSFWEGYVLDKINNDFQRLYTFLSDPCPNGPNPYIQRIEQNIALLRQTLAATSK